jgi:diguanylate cyclase (GGDEF)-like protein/PAS domain S-box-containing protein
MRGWARTGYALPVLVLAAVLAITYQLWQNERQNALGDLRAQFDFRAREAVGRIEQRMKTYEQVIRGLDGLFAHASMVGRDEFRDYVARLRLKENYPGIQAVRFAPLVPLAQKDRHIAAMRGQELAGYTIHPEGSRDFYTPVIYAEPFDDRNRVIFGYDTYSDLDHPRPGDSAAGLRRAAMERARDTGQAALSGKIRLVFESDKNPQAGFLMFLPVYRHDAPRGTLAERRANLIGWVSAVFRADDLMAGILGERGSELDIEIYDGGEISGKMLMYDADYFSRALSSSSDALFKTTEQLDIAGRKWTIFVHSMPAFEALLDKGKPGLIGNGGIVTGILLALLTWLLVGGRMRALRASRALSQELGERRQAEQALRASEERFRSVFENSKVGMNVLGPDYKYLKANWAFCEMTGYSEEELLARNCMEITHPDDIGQNSELYGKLFAGESDSFHIEMRYARKSGGLLWGDLTVSAVREASGKLVYAIAVIQDITDRKRAEEDLRLAATVYQNSSEAMMVADAGNRIIAVNSAFTQTTGYAAEEVIGKGPHILSSGRHDKAYYQRMWHALNTTGRWQGEIWNRRKSGEIYPEMLTINTIHNQDASVRQRVALFSDITEKKKSDEKIWQQANYDPLTSLPNRRMFRDRLEQELKKSHRSSLRLALFFIDLDRFKEINDTLGHDVGDMLLVEASHRVVECVREADTVARLGGDEFTVILAEIDDVGIVERVARNILLALSGSFMLEGEEVFISASIGITLYPGDATAIEALLKNADQAMYVSKSQGRNCYSYFTPSLQEAAQSRMRLTKDLRGALADGQFRVYYQPIVELSTGRIHKAEALTRWQHPERGLVSPAEFVPLAEETGLIVEIGDWVFKESARQVKRLRKLHDNDFQISVNMSRQAEFQISVNMSPVQFRSRRSPYKTWSAYLRELDLPGRSIAIEITEGLLLDADPSVTGKLLEFRDAGIQVAVDDFGTGYSSLSYLKKFNIDYLKIDQSFTRNLAAGSSDMAISEAIIVMAHKLGMKVIAEGVETAEQRDLLLAAGCDYGQGYLFSRPSGAEEFEDMLGSSR